MVLIITMDLILLDVFLSYQVLYFFVKVLIFVLNDLVYLS